MVHSTTVLVCVFSNFSKSLLIPEIAVPVSFSEELSYLHLSFCGKHCLASYASGENLYVNLKTNQCFPVRQIKVIDKMFRN